MAMMVESTAWRSSTIFDRMAANGRGANAPLTAASGLSGVYGNGNGNNYTDYTGNIIGQGYDLRNLLNDYYASKAQFTTGLSGSIQGLGKAALNMKRVNFNVGRPLIEAAAQASEAAKSLREKANTSESLNTKAQKSAGGALAKLRELSETRKSLSDAEKKNTANSAMNAVNDFLDRENGVDKKTVDKTEKVVDSTEKSDDDSSRVDESTQNATADIGALQSFLSGYSSDRGALSRIGARYEADRNTEDVVSAVKELADKYNSALDFLNGNRDISRRVSALADSFGSEAFFARSLADIGITADWSGELSVDEDRLSAALDSRPSAVEQALGQNGLAGRAERNVNLTRMHGDRLFPSIVSMATGVEEDPSQFMYSSRATAERAGYANTGNLVSMYF